ncbi:fumarate/nitrate reduction transcriptional regulator Fnr [Lamprobacter modestohalophilus]|uniref:Transcriptional regulator FNR n=1 Tax=Lamprobacter modestohalophilus TaxID=1064514 RepID=A0A9X0W5V0_9GAMM|nr:fumarate/nitrate reduction transcriptional regulator Fnr [Lamprobacter modestohalophilus]MCF7978615.1 fumarate/nitrate reduction transcriptional regulator Fnr [Chromatiaceae bacterium]MBK1617336.1 transcriptional regulator FNR [Lamprobacter modestohalophilus]MCF7995265.1 fumarate/nitrate reduction transcriptional regulator Fnr [Chromatiaceae bacterium]MCF8005720.1 fumarate/nitrate reduction transcriptional regulator Fnr [Chromatiaceae bacterium]MCF8016518.1 fumarate/nitrate reduction transc
MTQRKVISFDTIRVACKNCSLSQLCLPMGLAPEDVERLDSIIKRSRPLHRGDHLFRGGERFRSLYVVKTGSVKTYAPSEEGGEQVLGFHLPGEIIGLDAIDKACHACSAKVLETSAICEVPFQRFEELAAAIPSLQHQMYRLLSKEIGQDADMLLLLGKKNAEERLAAFLTSMSSRLSKRGLSPTDFYLSMSRHEIGSYLGLAVETVSRLFTRFQEDGLLRVDRKHVEVLNLSALEMMAGAPPSSAHKQRSN